MADLSSPPIMMASFATVARGQRRKQAHRSSRCRASASSAPVARVATGSDELASIAMVPGLTCFATPPPSTLEQYAADDVVVGEHRDDDFESASSATELAARHGHVAASSSARALLAS